jgi:hypothetical protein
MLQQRAIQRDGHVEEFSPEEGWDLLDRQARRYLKMDGEEFIARWDAGEFDDPDDRLRHAPEVMRVATLLPLVR